MKNLLITKAVFSEEADKLNKHENNKQSGEQGSLKEACLKVCLDTQVLKNPQHRCRLCGKPVNQICSCNV